MRSSILLPLLSFSTLLSIVLAASIPTPPASLPFQNLRHVRHRPGRRSTFNKLRDLVVQTIWEVPPYHRVCHTKSKPKVLNPESSTSQTLLARYGGDVVLRFNITSQDEAKALAEATNVLFVDVWEFNTEWADVRLGRDSVRVIHLETARNHADAHLQGHVLVKTSPQVSTACTYTTHA